MSLAIRVSEACARFFGSMIQESNEWGRLPVALPSPSAYGSFRRFSARSGSTGRDRQRVGSRNSTRGAWPWPTAADETGDGDWPAARGRRPCPWTPSANRDILSISNAWSARRHG